MFDTLQSLFSQTHAALFEWVVQPLLFELGLAGYLELAYGGTEWFLFGVIEIVVLYLLLRPLEALRPAETWTDRAAVRTDVIYTLLNRLGVIPLLVFSLLADPLALLEGWLRLHDIIPPQLEDFFPGLAIHPALSFCFYLVIIDFAEYWRHRFQHRVPLWWALHAVHHSQQQLSFWSDNRNHLLDEVIAGVWLAGVALVVGMPPGQFVIAVIALRGIESLSHANTRAGFGPVLEKILVGPRFHRVHHAIEYAPAAGRYGANFAVLLPVWDIIFGTADFKSPLRPTGIGDQIQGADYGRGFWAQQRLAIKRMGRVLRGQ